MPGVGKTSLALRWSQRRQDSFADGHLYMNLHGYDSYPLVSPEQALERFMVALGLPYRLVSGDVDAASAMFRSVVAGRRMLILLDNAAEYRQVRPLLPGPGNCMVIVTSRDHMSGLVARDGARRVSLGVLHERDAVELLSRVTHPERPGDTPPQFAELARLCARLPIALRIAAEHSLRRPWTSLSDLAEELRGESGPWRTLTAAQDDREDEMFAARSVFSWSYAALPGHAASAFRVLSIHPGHDFSGAAAAAATGTRSIQRSLDALTGAHLLEQTGPDRYQYHDLVRSYAMDQAHQDEPSGSLRNATRRVLTWYMRSADAAQTWINPNEPHVAIDAADEDPAPLTFASYEEAVQWFERERANLVTAVRSAAGQNMNEIAWKLAVVLRGLYMEFNPFEDWIATSTDGLRAAEAVGDLSASAELLESLGMACAQLHELDRSTEYLERALEVRQQTGDRPGTALTLNSLGLVLLRRHHLAEARAVFEECLDIYTELGDTHWPPVIQANLAEIIIGLHQHAEAVSLLDGALDAYSGRDDAALEGNALSLLSAARRGLGDTDGALTAALKAVDLASRHRNPMWEGYWLLELGFAQHAAGSPDDALASFERSADLHHGIGDSTREAQAWDGAGIARLALGQAGLAADEHRRAAEVFRRTEARWPLAQALGHLARALAADSAAAPAREAASEALTTLSEFTDPEADALRSGLRAFTSGERG